MIKINSAPSKAPAADPTFDQADRADEGLHYGRTWHRLHYCYRSSCPLHILDIGFGDTRSSLWAARLNPGATILGIDSSPEAVSQARAPRRYAPRSLR